MVDVLGARRRFAPLLLLAAGLGAVVAIQPKLPHDHEVALDFGSAAATITDVELAWTQNVATGEAALSTRWHFSEGAAPSRLSTRVRLPDGDWTADVEVQRAGTNETTHWSGRVNLEGSPFWKGADSREAPVILSVRQALR